MVNAGRLARGGPGLVVVGGSLAGVRAVASARRSGYDGRLTLVSAETHLPYDRPPLSKEFLSGDDAPPPRSFLTEDELRELDVTLVLGHPATALAPDRRAVVVADRDVAYERLIVATGVAARRPANLPVLPGVHTLRTLDDAVALRADFMKARRALIVGAGLIGSEIASAARSRGIDVTVIDAAATPLVRATGELVGGALSQLHLRHGVRLMPGTGLVDVLGEDRVRGALLSSGEQIETDLVVLGIGGTPNTKWLRSANMCLSSVDGGVLCDEYLRTSIDHVYAAGDIVHWPNVRLGVTLRLENWTNASEQGSRAALNALAPHEQVAHESVPYFWTDWYGNRIQFVGTAVSDEVTVVSGSLDSDQFIATYHLEGRIVGAVALNEPGKIMKYRRLIGSMTSRQPA